MTALLLLAPGTPMLFQGQEFAASGPFNYFADLGPEMAALTRDGRKNFLAQFPSIFSPEAQACLADPGDVNTFERCKLDFSERISHGPIYAMHRDLLRLRREDETLSKQWGRGLDGAVLAPATFVLRYFGKMDDDRLLIVNLGADLRLSPLPEPLLAPPDELGWQMIWSSENPVYGGSGVSQLETKEAWTIPAHAALVMSSARRQSKDDQ
jgi:maltooligosyltrehalose trehalohydrolase